MQVVDEIKSRLDAAEYIGRSVQLQRAGRNFRGLCPFHSEKTPSFYVFPDRQTWRCFGTCGEGGDLFTFVQKRDGVQFRDALRTLADAAGVQLTAENAAQRSRLDRLAGVVSATVDFYQRQLAGEDGGAARRYLAEQRGLNDQTIAAFRLGWAPAGWRSLRDYLLGRGYSDRDMIDAGVVVESESGGAPYDRFRARVVIPIADERGVFVALGGRGLEGEEPKYLNSPQTELFDKGHTLFGLHLAAEPARQEGVVVVVEGYMDVIGPWQAGFRNVVATMGTSLTEAHVALIRRHARRVVLAMDPDGAGMAAAERAGSLFIAGAPLDNPGRAARQANTLALDAQIEIRVATLPQGQDPDEVARADPNSWKTVIASAPPYPEFLLGRLLRDASPDSPLAVRQLIDTVRPVLEAVTDPIERARYIQRVAGRLRVPEAAVAERLRLPGRIRRRSPEANGVGRSRVSPEESLLAIVVRNPGLKGYVRGLPADLFADGLHREFFVRWCHDELATEGSPDDALAGLGARLEEMRLPPMSPDQARTAASAAIRAILNERLLQRQAAITEDLAALEQQIGANRLAVLSADAWNGSPVEPDSEGAMHFVMENLELGLSLHRRETSRLL